MPDVTDNPNYTGGPVVFPWMGSPESPEDEMARARKLSNLERYILAEVRSGVSIRGILASLPRTEGEVVSIRDAAWRAQG